MGSNQKIQFLRILAGVFFWPKKFTSQIVHFLHNVLCTFLTFFGKKRVFIAFSAVVCKKMFSVDISRQSPPPLRYSVPNLQRLANKVLFRYCGGLKFDSMAPLEALKTLKSSHFPIEKCHFLTFWGLWKPGFDQFWGLWKPGFDQFWGLWKPGFDQFWGLQSRQNSRF